MFKLFGDSNERVIKTLYPLVARINEKESEIKKISDSELKEKTNILRNQYASGVSLDDLLPEAFALVREAASRTLTQRHYDVQLMGGIILHKGSIAEMRTGEGKTLVATLPAYLNAISGNGVHVVTVNDYLARRDCVWMGQIYYALGFSVACINHDASYMYDPTHMSDEKKDALRDSIGSFKVVHEFLRPVSRKEAYGADIVYGTNSEFGFDYLRDNLVYEMDQKVQRGHHFALVDEIDSILIDEARTPLIISAPDEEAGDLYKKFSIVARQLKRDTHYIVDEKRRAIRITDEGIEEAQRRLGIENIYESGNIRYAHHIEVAIRAEALFKRDKDYVVRDGAVIIVDEFTGRLLPGRRYSEGLHQALEAKEGVSVQQESRTMATITFQNYFRMYKKLSGMTGTALTSAQEFHKVYNLEVTVIPTHHPIKRKDLPDIIYKTESAKLRAVAKEIQRRHATGQPVLCGTTSIEKNERLGAILKASGVPHTILNAKNHEQDAQIIAQAGRYGGVTVATNIAGRGVDIILGGNPPDPLEREKVLGVGGLFVLGTERHEARRIDNQLRGRAGRQGDPGESQFFVSLEDDVVRIFGGERIASLMDRLGMDENMPITNNLITRAIEGAQTKIESFNFDSRKYVLEFDDVMNKQRHAIYRLRNEVLSAFKENKNSLKELSLGYIHEYIRGILNVFRVSKNNDEKQKEQFIANLKTIAPDVLWESILKDFDIEQETALEQIQNELIKAYEGREKKIGFDEARFIEKTLFLQVIDMLWTEHIANMEYLRDSVRLRAYGQRDPLIEYKKEGLELYKRLREAIPALFVSNIFKVGNMVVRSQDNVVRQATSAPKPTTPNTKHKLGRNDPCWCGSGKKFKKCHGKDA